MSALFASLLGILLDKVVVPLVKQALTKIGYDLRISSIEKSQQLLVDGTIKALQAKTDKDKDDALHQISTSWNG